MLKQQCVFALLGAEVFQFGSEVFDPLCPFAVGFLGGFGGF